MTWMSSQLIRSRDCDQCRDCVRAQFEKMTLRWTLTLSDVTLLKREREGGRERWEETKCENKEREREKMERKKIKREET